MSWLARRQARRRTYRMSPTQVQAAKADGWDACCALLADAKWDKQLTAQPWVLSDLRAANPWRPRRSSDTPLGNPPPSG